jgi:hypothetical protein
MAGSYLALKPPYCLWLNLIENVSVIGLANGYNRRGISGVPRDKTKTADMVSAVNIYIFDPLDFSESQRRRNRCLSGRVFPHPRQAPRLPGHG